MPSGPDTFYLSAAQETQGNSTEHSRFANEELTLQFGKISVCDTHPQVTGLQGSPLPESWITTTIQGTALPDPNPTLVPVTTESERTQIVYPNTLSSEIYQLYPPVDFFANCNGILPEQSYFPDLDTEMDDIDIAMGVDYNPVSVNDSQATALPIITYAAPSQPPFPTQSFFNAGGNHDGHTDGSIRNGSNLFHFTSSQHFIPIDSSQPCDGPSDTEDDGGVFVAPDNVPSRSPLEPPPAVVLEENEDDAPCLPQEAISSLAATCRASLIPSQHQPAVYKQGPDEADTDVDTEGEDEPRQTFELEATEPFEEGEDKPLAAFLCFDQGIPAGLLEDFLRTPALPSQRTSLSIEHDSQGLKSFVSERTSFRQEGQEELAVLHAEAERLLESLERKLRNSPQIPQQIMPSTTDDNESAKLFERETTEPLEDGEDQIPTAFLSCEQCTDTQSSAVHEDRLEPFERETTEPLEEGEDQTPLVFLSYEQRTTGDNSVDAHSPIHGSADDENEPDQSFARESTKPPEGGEDKPPSTSMTPGTILGQRMVTQSTVSSTSPNRILFAPIQSQPELQPSYNTPRGNRRLVLNKHGRPIRPLSREKLKRTLGGAPCDLSSLTNTTAWAPSGADTGYDGDEREDRKDPSKRARCDVSKVPVADRGGNKQPRFGGSGRAHFHNAVARFATRSQGPVAPRRPILRRTDDETQLSASPSINISFITPSPSSAVGAAIQLHSPPPSTPPPRTKARSSITPRISKPVEMMTRSDSDISPPRRFTHLLVDELDRKHRRTPHHPSTEATGGGAVRHTRRSHREDWIHARRRRCCPTDDSILRFSNEPKKQKRKGPLSGIGVRFKLPDVEPVGA